MATITQWEILNILAKKKQGTQQIREALAEKGIDLTLRSVQRNLETLSESFPITSDHQNPAGWCWAEDCGLLDLPTMNSNTALTLKLTEQYLSEMLPQGCVAALQPYFKRASNLLNEVRGTGLGEWSGRVAKICRQQQLCLPEVNVDVLGQVFQALFEERQLSVSYQKLDHKQPVERNLHPLGLVFDNGVVYLVATVWNYQDARQFALHRMLSAKMLDHKAKRKKEFCLEKYIAEGNFSFPNPLGPIRLRLQVNDWLAGFLRERKLSEDQVIIDQEGGTIIEATVADTDQLMWWLLGHGTKVEVLEPPELRESMRRTIATLQLTYSEQFFEG